MGYSEIKGGALALALASAPTFGLANGFDRAVIPPALLFEDGNYAELNYSYVTPDVTGTFSPTIPGTPISGPANQPTGNIAESFSRFGAGIKFDLNDKLVFAARFTQPYGQIGGYSSNLTILPPLGAIAGLVPPSQRETLQRFYGLPGVTSDFNINAVDLLARYKFNESWSVFGGPRIQRLGSGRLGTPSGGGVFGWSDDTEVGFLAGIGYENQYTYTQVILTYTSEINHEFGFSRIVPGDPANTTALLTPNQTTITTPQNIQLTVRQPLSPKWAVFGSFRHSKWSDANIISSFTDGTVEQGTNYEDINTYTLGAARVVNDKLALTLTGLYQTGDDDTSLFAPRTDVRALSVGAQYWMNDKTRLRATYVHSWLGDGNPALGTLNFTNNTGQALAFQIGYFF